MSSPKQTFIGGTHNHYYSLTQKELNLETKEPCTFRIAPKFLKFITDRAEKAGVPRSKYIELILKRYFKAEPHINELYNVLDKIIEDKF